MGLPPVSYNLLSLLDEVLEHADNMFTFGANLTELMFSRCAPIQAVPARFIVYESFKHYNDDVLPLRIKTHKRYATEYFVAVYFSYNHILCPGRNTLFDQSKTPERWTMAALQNSPLFSDPTR